LVVATATLPSESQFPSRNTEVFVVSVRWQTANVQRFAAAANLCQCRRGRRRRLVPHDDVGLRTIAGRSSVLLAITS
jgi:hypothetical protein